MAKTRVTSRDVGDALLTDADIAAANKDGTAATPSLRTLGTGAAQAAGGTDARLSDARTPTAHAASHQDGGSDELDVTGLVGAGGAHPNLATHDALGLATDAELAMHAGAADPHTGYRLESADHSHATPGLQAGQVAHSALSGIAATDHHAAPLAGPDADTTIDAAGAAGTAGAFARSAHGHQLVTRATAPAAIGTAAAGTSGAAPNRGDHVHATGAGTPSTQAFGDAAATGSGPAAAMTDHKHAMPADPVTAHAAAADPHAGYVLESLLDAKGDLITASADNTPAKLTVGADDRVLMADAAAAAGLKWAAPATPSAQAFGDAAAEGTGDTFTRGDHKHGMPADPVTAHAAAADPHAGYVLESLLDAKGDLITASADNTPAKVTVGADDTILMADAAAAGGLKWVAPGAPQAVSTAGATGTGDTFSRGDHVHAHEAAHTAHDTIWDAAGDLAIGTGADTAAKLAITVPAVNILEVLGVVNGESTASWKAVHDATNPAALGAAAPGTALTAAHRDHVHPTTGLALDPHGAAQHTDITRSLFLSANGAKLDAATAANLGASPDLSGVVAYADAATQGAFWTFQMPLDWASGVITIQPVWSPGATDGVAHAVRWSMICKTLANGVNVVTAGTTVTFTGASAARTASVLVYDTATSTTLTPAAAGDLFRIELRRIGADAADTYVGVVNLLGIIVTYTANQ